MYHTSQCDPFLCVIDNKGLAISLQSTCVFIHPRVPYFEGTYLSQIKCDSIRIWNTTREGHQLSSASVSCQPEVF